MNTAEAPERLALEYGLADGIAVAGNRQVDVASCGVLREGLLRIVTDEGFGGLVVNLARRGSSTPPASGSWLGSGRLFAPQPAVWPWRRRPCRPGACWIPRA